MIGRKHKRLGESINDLEKVSMIGRKALKIGRKYQ